MATSATAQIKEAAPRNRELLSILSETDHAVPDLERQRRYISDLDSQLKELGKRIGVLNQNRSKEQKEHAEYRDSVMRRFAYKVARKTDKFDAKAAKEEREYFDALQQVHAATEQEKSLQQLREEALQARADLERQVARHNQAQQELDGLYNRIFSGTTPEFPEEDNSEHRCTVALQTYQDARTKADAQGQAVASLQEVSKRFGTASMSIEEALDASRFDMFGGGSMADMMERNALHKAEMAINDAQWHFRHAKQMDPMIHDLPPLKIASGSIMSDVFFDNIFTDMAFHDKIKDSRMEVQKCVSVLNAQLQGATMKRQELDRDSKSKSEVLDQARLDLQKLRQGIFERAAGAGDNTNVPNEPPPEYSA